MDAQGLHAMVCKKAPGKIARHHVFNDIIWRDFSAAGIPAVKEPFGLDRHDGKRPDRLTLITWHGGRSLVWDVIVVSQLAASYVDRAATDTGTIFFVGVITLLFIYTQRDSDIILFHIYASRFSPPSCR